MESAGLCYCSVSEGVLWTQFGMFPAYRKGGAGGIAGSRKVVGAQWRIARGRIPTPASCNRASI